MSRRFFQSHPDDAVIFHFAILIFECLPKSFFGASEFNPELFYSEGNKGTCVEIILEKKIFDRT